MEGVRIYDRKYKQILCLLIYTLRLSDMTYKLNFDTLRQNQVLNLVYIQLNMQNLNGQISSFVNDSPLSRQPKHSERR